MNTGAWRLLLLLSATPLQLPAQETSGEPLPDPLTLEYALSRVDAPHPQLAGARAHLAARRAERLAADTLSAATASLHARARYVEPNSQARIQTHDDHALVLNVRKPLLDFGRSQSARDAADASIASERWRFFDVRQRRWLDIAQRYFDVLLADLRYLRDNEDMAVAFVRLQRNEDRNKLGQLSDIDLRALRSRYQDSRARRYQAAAERQASRARLANALNRPDHPPARLTAPRLREDALPRPDFEQLLRDALEHNPRLRALRADVRAARDRIRGADAMTKPVLYAEVDGGLHTRRTNTVNLWRVGIEFSVPLTTGGAARAEGAKRQAELADQRALLAGASLQVRQDLLDAWLQLDTLGAEGDAAQAFSDYRDLYLDRSRARYEQEVQTDLGDAMVELSEARLRSARVRFERAMAWARMRALGGASPEALSADLFGKVRTR